MLLGLKGGPRTFVKLVFGQYIFNFNGLMIGPQYPLSLHRKLIKGELTDRPGQAPNSG